MMTTKGVAGRYFELMKLLADPVRSRIYFEVLLNGEVNAQALMKHLTIKRSTLTHHLNKLVEAGIFDVNVQAVGRPVKYYRLKKDLKKKIIVETGGDPIENLKQQIIFVQSVVAHMRLISHLARAEVNRLEHKLASFSKDTSNSLDDTKTDQLGFFFNLLSENEMSVWNKGFKKFLREMEEEIESLRDQNLNEDNFRHVVFLGNVPIVRE